MDNGVWRRGARLEIPTTHGSKKTVAFYSNDRWGAQLGHNFKVAKPLLPKEGKVNAYVGPRKYTGTPLRSSPQEQRQRQLRQESR